MKSNHKKRSRKLMRKRNKNRVNRLRNQQAVIIAPLFSPVFVLVLIRLGLEEQSTPEKVLARLRLHIEKLTGNVYFPVTDPSVADLEGMEEDLEESIDEVNAGNIAEIPTRDARVADAKEMIRQLSYNIQYLSKGDAVKIQSAGFDVRKNRGPSVPPGQVMNLVAKPVGPGKIELSWDRDDHARFYIIETNNNPLGAPWQAIGTSRRIKFVVDGLQSGLVYYYRVISSNGNETGNPSDIVEQRSL